MKTKCRWVYTEKSDNDKDSVQRTVTKPYDMQMIQYNIYI